MESPAVSGIYLQTVVIKGVSLSRCPASGGIWFDAQDMMPLLEAPKPLLENLLEMPPADAYQRGDSVLLSPRDPMAGMQIYCFNTVPPVLVDECPKTGSLWLGYGALKNLRKLQEAGLGGRAMPRDGYVAMLDTLGFGKDDGRARQYLDSLVLAPDPAPLVKYAPEGQPMRYWPVVYRCLLGWEA
jgi:Zn-finger nucleic acid-binding protein